MNYKTTRNELKQLLETEQYRVVEYPKFHMEEFEKVNGWGGDILTTFDDLTEQLGRVPSQSEFINEGTERYKKLFYEDGANGRKMFNYWKNGRTILVTLQWTENLVTAIQNRLDRTYRSYLLEYATMIQLRSLFPNYKLVTQHYLDITMGVDIAVITPEQKVFYVHITSNTYWGRGKVAEKGTKKPYIQKDGKKHFWQRNFDGSHVVFAYDKYKSYTTDIVNGNILFNDQYIIDEVEAILQSEFVDGVNKDCQLYQFYVFLIQNKIESLEVLKETIK